MVWMVDLNYIFADAATPTPMVQMDLQRVKQEVSQQRLLHSDGWNGRGRHGHLFEKRNQEGRSKIFHLQYCRWIHSRILFCWHYTQQDDPETCTDMWTYSTIGRIS